ncbi:hypothetical protein THASP1DRAFT_27381 [Thamnocephalis sphaerospora]|uniref:Uncharacterized protein n=1 Tax=Thamnocephalis sphaerospora TaxID=78915 RepID=A0A4P9XXR1_9FUNG|nr:hypothetical protein THASP1DRAFT_27381 [Thamnocephalis sphaerospora]|eukprot:RKP10842.1 hypothetical protein THASP1DRAFT_27381 [Thamnocephalis sphaerospora]
MGGVRRGDTAVSAEDYGKMQTENRVLRNHLAQSHERIDELESQCRRHKEETDTLQNDIARMVNDLEREKSKLEDERANAKQCANVLRRLEADLNAATERLTRLESDYAEAQNALDCERTRASESVQKLRLAEAAEKATADSVLQLEAKCKQLGHDVAELRMQRTQAMQDVKSKAGLAEHERKTHQETLKDKEELENRLQELSTAMQTCEEDCRAQKNELESWRSEHHRLLEWLHKHKVVTIQEDEDGQSVVQVNEEVLNVFSTANVVDRMHGMLRNGKGISGDQNTGLAHRATLAPPRALSRSRSKACRRGSVDSDTSFVSMTLLEETVLEANSDSAGRTLMDELSSASVSAQPNDGQIGAVPLVVANTLSCVKDSDDTLTRYGETSGAISCASGSSLLWPSESYCSTLYSQAVNDPDGSSFYMSDAVGADDSHATLYMPSPALKVPSPAPVMPSSSREGRRLRRMQRSHSRLARAASAQGERKPRATVTNSNAKAPVEPTAGLFEMTTLPLVVFPPDTVSSVVPSIATNSAQDARREHPRAVLQDAGDCLDDMCGTSQRHCPPESEALPTFAHALSSTPQRYLSPSTSSLCDRTMSSIFSADPIAPLSQPMLAMDSVSSSVAPEMRSIGTQTDSMPPVTQQEAKNAIGAGKNWHTEYLGRYNELLPPKPQPQSVESWEDMEDEQMIKCERKISELIAHGRRALGKSSDLDMHTASCAAVDTSGGYHERNLFSTSTNATRSCTPSMCMPKPRSFRQPSFIEQSAFNDAFLRSPMHSACHSPDPSAAKQTSTSALEFPDDFLDEITEWGQTFRTMEYQTQLAHASKGMLEEQLQTVTSHMMNMYARDGQEKASVRNALSGLVETTRRQNSSLVASNTKLVCTVNELSKRIFASLPGENATESVQLDTSADFNHTLEQSLRRMLDRAEELHRLAAASAPAAAAVGCKMDGTSQELLGDDLAAASFNPELLSLATQALCDATKRHSEFAKSENNKVAPDADTAGTSKTTSWPFWWKSSADDASAVDAAPPQQKRPRGKIGHRRSRSDGQALGSLPKDAPSDVALLEALDQLPSQLHAVNAAVVESQAAQNSLDRRSLLCRSFELARNILLRQYDATMSSAAELMRWPEIDLALRTMRSCGRRATTTAQMLMILLYLGAKVWLSVARSSVQIPGTLAKGLSSQSLDGAARLASAARARMPSFM